MPSFSITIPIEGDQSGWLVNCRKTLRVGIHLALKPCLGAMMAEAPLPKINRD